MNKHSTANGYRLIDAAQAKLVRDQLREREETAMLAEAEMATALVRESCAGRGCPCATDARRAARFAARHYFKLEKLR